MERKENLYFYFQQQHITQAQSLGKCNTKSLFARVNSFTKCLKSYKNQPRQVHDGKIILCK